LVEGACLGRTTGSPSKPGLGWGGRDREFESPLPDQN